MSKKSRARTGLLAKTELPIEEWDFRSSRISDDEVWLCLEYERSRETQTTSWRKWIDDFRREPGRIASALPSQQFDTLFDHALKADQKSHVAAEGLSWPRLFYTLWPEWPEKAFLKVPEPERRRRHGKWTKAFESPSMEPLEVIPLGEIIEWREGLQRLRQLSSDPAFTAIARPLVDAFGQDKVREELARDDVKHILPVIYAPPHDIVAFKVNHGWEHVNEVVAKFEEWLSSRRKELGLVEAIKTRGGPKLWRSQLTALGAWRLKRSGMSYTQAHVYTEEVAGRALFANEQRWSNAVRRASIEMGLGRPLPRKESS